MKLSPQEQITVRSYDEVAQQYVESRNTPDYWLKELNLLREAVPAGKILEVGSGGGREAYFFKSYSYDYVGVDVSNGLIQIAQTKVPEANFVLANAYALPFPDNSFDGLWSAATLLHIPKSRINEALWEINRVLKPGAKAYLTLKQGESSQMIAEDYQEDGGHRPRYFSYWQPEEFDHALRSNNFFTLEFHTKETANTTWLCFLAEKDC